jgi:hypothetical protein
VLFTNDQYVYMFYSESTKCKKNPTSRKPARWSPGGDIRMVKSRDGFTWTAPVTIYTQVRALAPPMNIFLSWSVALEELAGLRHVSSGRRLTRSPSSVSKSSSLIAGKAELHRRHRANGSSYTRCYGASESPEVAS